MKKFTFFLSVLIATAGFAQRTQSRSALPPHRTCGTMEADSMVRAKDPSMGTHQGFEMALQQVINQLQQNRSMMPGPYNIPTIVHVIHNGEAVGTGTNISQAQVYSQYDVLNEDYNNTNADGSLVPAAFQPFRGSLQMNFKKALRNPSGVTLAEPGINRINRNTMGWTAPPYTQSYIDNTIKPNSIWDPTKYFNIWVMDLGGGLLGYAQFPPQPTPPLGGLPAGGSATTDGVVVLYTAFGRVGNVGAPYNKGRTLTHEAGHFFGLRHIWGDEAQCTADDYVTDTPQQKDKNFGCPSYPQTNGAGGRCVTSDPSSMFMNYMDYTDDACMYMFTQGQATRMEAVISSSPRRVELTTSNTATPLIGLDASIATVLAPTGSSCSTGFTPVVTLSNNGSTTLTSVVISYNVDGGTNTVYTWTGSLVSGGTTNVTLPSGTSTVGSHTLNVSTSAPNGGTDANTANDSNTQSFSIVAPPSTVNLPLTEGFVGTAFAPTGWGLLNPNTNNTWARATNAGGFGTTTNSAKMDNYSGSVNISGQTDDLLTPNLNLSNANSTLAMTFDVAYARYDASYSDSLLVEVTTNCGGTWTRVYAKGGTGLATAPDNTNAFTPTAAQWRTETINLASYAGNSNAQFRFRSVSGYGNNVYVDNVNLSYTGCNVSVSPASASICIGGSTTLTASGATTYSWSPSAGLSATTGAMVTATPTATTTYTVTGTAGACNSTSTVVVTVNPLPNVLVSPASTTICPGGFATLVASGASTYNWSPGTGLTGTTGSTVTASPSSTITYTVTGTSTAGCAKTSTAVVTVGSPMTVSVTPSAAQICSGISTTLVASGATTYNWSPATGLSATNTASVTATPTSTITYTVTGTSGSCTGTATAVVTVNPLPNITATSSASQICVGTNSSLSATGAGTGGTYTWNPGNMTGATVSVLPASTTTYTVTGTNTNGCSKTATITITVNPLPNVLVSPAVSSICVGSSASLTASGANVYTWSPSSSLNTSTGDTVSATPLTTTTYTVTGTQSTTGCTKTTTAVVNVNQLPVASVTPNSTTICSGSSTSITASGGTTYSWSPAGSLSASSGATVTATPLSTTTYTVSVTNSAGCVNTATTYVGVNPNPTVTATGSSSSICVGSSATLSASGAQTYVWNPGNLSGSTVTVTPSTSTTFTVTGSTAGCSNTATYTVAVNQAPVVTVSGNNSICAGNTTALTASGANTYLWSPSASLSSTSGATVLANPSTTTTYTVSGTSVAGCIGTNQFEVSVSNPTASAIATPDSAAIGTPITFSNSSTGASAYTWNFGDGNTSASASPTHTYGAAGTYTVTLTAENGSCADSVSFTVEITTPNGITSTNETHVKVYPNPTEGNVTILPGSAPVTSLVIYDAIGNIVLSEANPAQQRISLDLSGFAAGLYYIQVTSGKENQVIKLNLQK